MGIFSRSSGSGKKVHRPPALLTSTAASRLSTHSSLSFHNNIGNDRASVSGISTNTSSSEILTRTLSSTNLDITDGRLGLNLLNSDDRQLLTYVMLDQADRLGDDDDKTNIVDKVAEEESDSSDESSDDESNNHSSSSNNRDASLKKTCSHGSGNTKNVDLLMSPPPRYNSLAPLMPRYRIVPRDEEGHETLPRYRSVIFKEALLEKKQEMMSPFETAPSRKWKQVHAELNNTQLSLYSISTIGRGGASKKFTDSSTDKTYKKKSLIKTYTLQYADIGLADDYKKKQNAIRIRAESEQFLLAAGSELDCVEWARSLQMGSEIALPLEERKLPKLRSIPRRRNRHRRRELREEERMSRELMLRPYSSRMSTVSVGSTARSQQRRPSMNTRTSSGGGASIHDSSGGGAPLRPSMSQHTSVHFRTPKQHPRRHSQPASHTSTYSSSLLTPIGASSSVYMYDDTDFSDDSDDSEDEDGTLSSTNVTARASDRRNAVAPGTNSTTGTNSTVTDTRRDEKVSSDSAEVSYANGNESNGDNANANGNDPNSNGNGNSNSNSNSNGNENGNEHENTNGEYDTTNEALMDESSVSLNTPRISVVLSRDDEDSEDDNGLDNDNDSDEDSEEDVPLARTTTQATTTSMTFTFGYKWNPAKLIPSTAQLIQYTKRCLVQLAEDAPWTDKKVIKNGVKYIVRDNKLERISSSVPPTIQQR